MPIQNHNGVGIDFPKYRYTKKDARNKEIENTRHSESPQKRMILIFF